MSGKGPCAREAHCRIFLKCCGKGQNSSVMRIRGSEDGGWTGLLALIGMRVTWKTGLQHIWVKLGERMRRSWVCSLSDCVVTFQMWVALTNFGSLPAASSQDCLPQLPREVNWEIPCSTAIHLKDLCDSQTFLLGPHRLPSWVGMRGRGSVLYFSICYAD